MADFFIGTMGFSYKDWVPTFYPQGLTAGDFLGFYSGIFNAVEIDSSFYGIPPVRNIERWAAVTPDYFQICVKTPRAITHEAGLIRVEAEMTTFLNVVRLLEDKLGAILIQFPPSFRVDQQEVLDAFLGTLPADMRFAVEFRNRSWYTPETAALLSKYRVCWAATEFERLPKNVENTTDFQYIRLIGYHRRFSHHDHEQIEVGQNLKWWAERVSEFPDTVETVYVFVNNDYSGHAPATVRRFMNMIGLPSTKPPPRQDRLL